MESFFFYWLIIAVLFLILEIGHSGLFFFISFSSGALTVAMMSLFMHSLFYQIIFFFIISAVSFASMWFKVQRFNTGGHGHKTNIFALQGKKAVVVEEIRQFCQGRVKIGNELWVAKARNDEHYKSGDLVEVIDIVGCHCIVRGFNSK